MAESRPPRARLAYAARRDDAAATTYVRFRRPRIRRPTDLRHPAGSEDFAAFRTRSPKEPSRCPFSTLVPTPRTAPDACVDASGRGLLDALAAGDDGDLADHGPAVRGAAALRGPRGAAQRRRRRRGRAAHLGAAVPQRRPDQRPAAACPAGCRRPPAARRWRSCAASSARIPSEDVADHVAPDDTRPRDGAAWTTSCAGRCDEAVDTLPRHPAPDRARAAARAGVLRRAQPRSWASRGAASARCADARSGPCARSSSPASR